MEVIKKLIDLPSGHKAEAIYYESPTKQVICFSTQLNCAVGCEFCASTKGSGKTVNLTVEDMIEQVWTLDLEYGNYNTVMLYSIMGEGEPFLNYDNVIKVMHWLEQRVCCKIAVSTSGYKIRKFANEEFKVPVKLQVSIHSADERIRRLLVPNAPGIHGLVDSIKYYHEHNDGEVELNFTLMPGINDNEYAMECIIDKFPNEHIKLSKLNGAEGTANADWCYNYLKDRSYSVEYQESPGAAIAAGCGQTRGKVLDNARKTITGVERCHEEARNSKLRF